MRILIWIAISLLMFVIVYTPTARSQTLEYEGYTIVPTNLGPQVCLGTWVPSTSITQPGVCHGTMMDMSQLTALSARESADDLNNLLTVLTSIDQRLAVNNEQIEQLIRTTASLAPAVHGRQGKESLHDAISQRFNALPKDLMANDLFRKEVMKLEEDILEKVDKTY